MKGAYFYYGIFFIIFFSFFSPHVEAKLLKGFYSGCLDAKMWSSQAAKGQKAQTTTTEKVKEDDNSRVPHSAELLIIPARKPKWPNAPVYVFMCSGRSGACGAVSTDGTDLNLKIFGQSASRCGGNKDEEDPGLCLENRGSIGPGTNPNKTDAEALHFQNAPLVWSAYSEQAIPHSWTWVQSIDPPADGSIPTPMETLAPDEFVMLNDNEYEVGQGLGLKIGQLSWLIGTTPTPAPGVTPGTSGGTGVKCANIQWDPRGYIFDAETLNPVKETKITLYEKNPDASYTQVRSMIGITNPYTTATNSGQFNFFVNPGLYKIEVNSPHATIANLNTLNPQHTQLFADEKNETHIYEKGKDIVEVAGRVAVAHIPVQVTNKTYILRDIQLIMEDAVIGFDEKTNKSQMYITGTVSHPKSKIIVTLSALTADGVPIVLPPMYKATNDFGEYEFSIDQEIMLADNKPAYLQNINIRIELNSFYLAQKATSKAGTTVSYNLKAIPRYIEGIAYDDKGAPIPNAIVGIYPHFSLSPMYMVIADSTGRFQIGSDHVPELNFNLKYKKPNGDVVQVDPHVFVQQNVAYYSQNNLNPFANHMIPQREDDAMWKRVNREVPDKDVELMSSNKPKKQSLAFYGTVNTQIKREGVNAISPGAKSASPINLSVIMTVFVIVLLLIGSIALWAQMKKGTTSYSS